MHKICFFQDQLPWSKALILSIEWLQSKLDCYIFGYIFAEDCECEPQPLAGWMSQMWEGTTLKSYRDLQTKIKSQSWFPCFCLQKSIGQVNSVTLFHPATPADISQLSLKTEILHTVCLIFSFHGSLCSSDVIAKCVGLSWPLTVLPQPDLTVTSTSIRCQKYTNLFR